MSILTAILTLVIAVLLGMLYHKIFDVTYFSGRALLSEIIVCIGLGGIIATKLIGIIKFLLPIIIIIVILMYLGGKGDKKPNNEEDKQESPTSSDSINNDNVNE